MTYLANVGFNRTRWCFATLSNYFVVSNICSSSTFSFDNKSTYYFSSMVSLWEIWTSHKVEWRLCSTRWYSYSKASHSLATWGRHCVMAVRDPSFYTCSIDNKLALKVATSPYFIPRITFLHLKSSIFFSWMMLASCKICLHPDTLENCDSMLNTKPTLCSFSCPNFVWSFATTWWACSNTWSTKLSPPPTPLF